MSFLPFGDVKVPLTHERALASGGAWEMGALLVVNGNGEYEEAGADPATVNAVSLVRAGADTTYAFGGTAGFNITNRKEFPTNKIQAMSPVGLWTADYVGALPSPDNAGQFGVIRDTDGLWKVDFNEITALVVNLVRNLNTSPELVHRVLVSFIPSVIGSI